MIVVVAPDQTTRDLATMLAWALDIIDMYDARLVALGDPHECVYSKVHVDAKANARTLIRLAATKALS